MSSDPDVSVLFSEPKIPQSPSARGCGRRRKVSVLFSEPKIPQFGEKSDDLGVLLRFSALQRAENSSIDQRLDRNQVAGKFQCSSASRKFLNDTVSTA